VDLVVVGPEAPLVKGVADAVGAAGIPVFGPSARAARIEGSKAFAKELMSAARVPTAAYREFSSAQEAEAYAATCGQGVVVKADGLAAGKGVVVAGSAEEAVAAVRSLSQLGEAGSRLVLEERLEGEEVSVIALCDGERFVLLPPAQDHKRVRDGDQGPNTGGMGAYCPTGAIDSAGLETVGAQIIAPMLRELSARGMPFRGALYAGLMMTAAGPKVIEFNCRFGDPETQVILMQVEEDLLPLLHACATGKLAQSTVSVAKGVSVGVVAAAENYPGTPASGDVIEGLGEVAQAVVFHAGTRQDGGRLVTAGGRVLTVCAHGEDFEAARARAYAALEKVRFRGMHFRRDIGARELARKP
jgi:phosphoribosylamine--glycine ligase